MRRYINFRTWPHSIRSWIWLPSYGCPTSWATEPVVWKCWSSCVGLTFNHFCWSNDDSGKSSLKHLRLRVLTSENFQHVEGCEPNIWDELNLMQKGLSKTWSVGLCFSLILIFLTNIWWRHFSLNLWAVLNLNFRGYFLFLPNVERVVGWLGREWIIVGWRSPQNYSLGIWGINTMSILTSCRYFYFSIFIRSLRVRGLIHHWSVSHGLLWYFPLLSNHFFEGKYCFFPCLHNYECVRAIYLLLWARSWQSRKSRRTSMVFQLKQEYFNTFEPFVNDKKILLTNICSNRVPPL